jgi:toxin FitB
LRYLLDTNVLSETRRRSPNPNVLAWLAAAEPGALFLSVLTLGEIRKGVALLRQRGRDAEADRIAAWLAVIETDFADRLVPVDAAIAICWGDLAAARPRPVIDSLLAATALHHGFIVVTRNVGDFEGTGVTSFDPWTVPI